MADKKISQLNNVTTPLVGTETLPVVQGGETKKVTVDNLTAGKAVSAASLTTTGSVGIGTATPTHKLQVSTAGNNYIASVNTTGSTSALLLGAESGKTVLYSWTTPGGATGVPLTFIVGAAENMRLDSAGDLTLQTGNLKLATAGKGIDFSANAHAAGMTSELLNWYEEGTWTPTIIGSTSGGATTYTLQAGRYTRIGRIVHIEMYAVWTAGNGVGNLQVIGLPFTCNNASTYPSLAIGIFSDISIAAGSTPLAFVNANSTRIWINTASSGGGAGAYVAASATGSLNISGTYSV